jgi:hypothetical protein
VHHLLPLLALLPELISSMMLATDSMLHVTISKYQHYHFNSSSRWIVIVKRIGHQSIPINHHEGITPGTAEIYSSNHSFELKTMRMISWIQTLMPTMTMIFLL